RNLFWHEENSAEDVSTLMNGDKIFQVTNKLINNINEFSLIRYIIYFLQYIMQCFSVAFLATRNSRFREADLALASYIFYFNYDPKEELVSNDHCSGIREALMTLKPRHSIVDDVLILVVSMLTHNDDGHKWFLPTTFAIYVPIHVNFHWFLMVVNISDQQIVYLDSKKSKIQKKSRMTAVNKASFLENILGDGTYKLSVGISPTISTYKLVDPEVTQQEDGSNDCGIYVAQWMILSNLWGSYDVG
ncbi:hypothetical protein HN51_062639, partial [Arachis hypogaea]